MPYPVTWLDVFTDRPLTGNQLAVVHDADALDDATLQAYARETRLSETTFVQAPTVAGADYRNRIFDPSSELPLAGHPSLGTAVAVAHHRGQRQTSYVQQTPAGLQPVDVSFRGDLLACASMLQEAPEFGPEVPPTATYGAAGLDLGDAHPDLRPQAVSTGYRHIVAFVRDASVLQRCAPRAEPLTSLLAEHGCGVLALAALTDEPAALEVRVFYPAFGAALEDPATGSAAGCLLAYLARTHDQKRVEISQGVAMRRPSRIAAEFDGERPRVSGDVVVLGTGELNL